jgi:hypothetical protein
MDKHSVMDTYNAGSLNAIVGYLSAVEMDTERMIASIAINVSAFDLCGLYSAMGIFGFIAGVG